MTIQNRKVLKTITFTATPKVTNGKQTSPRSLVQATGELNMPNLDGYDLHLVGIDAISFGIAQAMMANGTKSVRVFHPGFVREAGALTKMFHRSEWNSSNVAAFCRNISAYAIRPTFLWGSPWAFETILKWNLELPCSLVIGTSTSDVTTQASIQHSRVNDVPCFVVESQPYNKYIVTGYVNQATEPYSTDFSNLVIKQHVQYYWGVCKSSAIAPLIISAFLKKIKHQKCACAPQIVEQGVAPYAFYI